MVATDREATSSRHSSSRHHSHRTAGEALVLLFAGAAEGIALGVATRHPDLAAQGDDRLARDHCLGQLVLALDDVLEALVVAIERGIGVLWGLDGAHATIVRQARPRARCRMRSAVPDTAPLPPRICTCFTVD